MCKAIEAQIPADGAAIAKAVSAIAALEQSSNPELATELNAAAGVLVVATANWKTDTPTDDINTAATALQAILAAIPLTAPYATFVGIAVAALDILIANLATQGQQTTSTIANARLVLAYIDAMPENPYRGMVHIKSSWLGPRRALHNAWNNQVDLQPELGIKKL